MEPQGTKLEYATRAEVDADAIEHVAIFHGFARLIFWFGAHALIDVFGIIFLLLGHVFLGLLFLVIGTTVLVSAIVLVVRGARHEHQTTLPAGSGREPTGLRPAASRASLAGT
jgi:hypothetical protein